jgi:DNA-binding transcriptional LysR family regulator
MLRNGRGVADATERLGWRAIEIFLAFAQTEHMGHAAEELGMSISSIQRAVRALEIDLGIALVEREGRRVRLLPAGRVLAEHAQFIVRSHAEAVHATRAAAGWERRTLKLGHTSSLGFSVVPGYIAALLRREPGMHVQLRQGSTHALVDALIAGELDAAFVSTLPENPELIAVPLFNDPLLLAVPADDALARREQVELASVRDRGFITLTESSVSPSRFIRLCANAGFRPRIVLEADDLCTMEGAVAAGIGLAVVPRSMDQHAHTTIVHVRIASTEGPVTRHVGLVYPREGRRSEALAMLLSLAVPHTRSVH